MTAEPYEYIDQLTGVRVIVQPSITTGRTGVEPSPAVPQAQIPETHEAPPELLPRNDHDINVVGNWVGLSADEQVRFVECLRAVGFEIVASSQLSASIAREKALQTQLHVELIDRVARAEATIAELVEVVTIMRDAMNDKAHAWNHARKWLDEHDIYHGDLQENAVLAEVCKVLLARATGAGIVKMTDEEKVLKVWPDARFCPSYLNCGAIISGTPGSYESLSAGWNLTESQAWANAVRKLEEQSER